MENKFLSSDFPVIIGGSFAGLAQTFVGHPFDTMKVKLVNNGMGFLSKNGFKGGGSTKFLRSLYKGVTSPMLGSVISNVQIFYGHSLLQKKFKNTLLSGGILGVSLAFIESPIEYLKTQKQISGLKNQPKYSDLIRKNKRNLFRGLDMTICRNLFSYGYYFWSYNFVKKKFENKYKGAFAGGAFAGFLSWSTSYHFDNLKTRMQSNKEYKNVLDCIKKISYNEKLQKRTLRKFFIEIRRGFVPCIIRGTCVNPFIFLAYEITLENFS